MYGNPAATQKDIDLAIDRANARRIIEKLSEGVDSNVGTSGSQLSGGEKQRIALARAFIKQPRILILDEATSALDRANEIEVQRAIESITESGQNITVVVIAHRLSTIRKADKIIVLEAGEKIEEGTHESLLKEFPDGTYSGLVKRQQEAEAV